MLGIVSNFLYCVVLPYVLAVAMARLSDRARFAHVDRRDFADGYLREPPSSDEPALLARVVGAGEGSMVTATLLSLERKGVVSVDRTTEPPALRLGDDLEREPARPGARQAEGQGRGDVLLSLSVGVREGRLSAYERLALDMVFIDGRLSATARSLSEARLACPAYVRRLRHALAAEADRDLHARHLVEGVSPSLLWLAVIVVVAYVLVGLLVVGLDVAPMVLFGLPGLAALVSFSRPREVFTAEGRTLLVRCRAFQRYLAHFTHLSEAHLTDVTLWGELLVYGAAVHTTSVVDNELMPAALIKDAPVAPAWYVAYVRGGCGKPSGCPEPPRG
ncbi:DUF2207 family protein [Olsenella profusa]|uniref:DUF2207 domain-containing protein n=1 Tax=Olsenella profusa TaxID=138595 RepID=A0ABS2F126_9ACTN|nr:DUF2207 domain-containing protein [Olsenella profusa]MBM6774228.1 DUF2207 domain-containing protein [Olsenella profusa]